MDAVFKLICEFIKLCVDFDFFDEKITISHLISELLKRKGMIVLESLGAVFQIAVDVFPFVFNPFLELCKSLIQLPGNYDTVSTFFKSDNNCQTKKRFKYRKIIFFNISVETLVSRTSAKSTRSSNEHSE